MIMDPVAKKKWVDALRSGKYNQGRGRLRHDDEYCCLGVFCDLIDDGEWSEPTFSGIYFYKVGDKDSSGWLVDPILEHYCISNYYMDRLMAMNDEGKSFDAIADYIEKYL
jgi:hypothetical protein